MIRYHVYILVNTHHNGMYIGMTDDLQRRLKEHAPKNFIGFTYQYNVDKLVYYETMESLESAIAREKQLKKWNRNKKDALISRMNPSWNSLAIRFNSSGTMEQIHYNVPADGDPSASLGIKRL